MTVTHSSNEVIEEIKETVVSMYSDKESSKAIFDVANKLFQMDNWIYHARTTHKDKIDERVECIENSVSIIVDILSFVTVALTGRDCGEMIKDIGVEYERRRKENLQEKTK